MNNDFKLETEPFTWKERFVVYGLTILVYLSIIIFFPIFVIIKGTSLLLGWGENND